MTVDATVGATRARVAGSIMTVAGVAGGLALVAAGWLSVYPGALVVPKGADTSHYVWRFRLVTALGVDALPTFPGSHLLNANADRPGLPAAYAIFHALGGPDPDRFAFVFPAVFGVVLGLAAVGVARGSVREGRPALPVYAFVAGAGLPLAFAANGKFAELATVTLLVAAAALLVPALRGERRPSAAALILLVAAWSVHWIVTAVVAGTMLVGTALWVLAVPGLGFDDGRLAVLRRLAAVTGLAAAGAAFVSLVAPGSLEPPLAVTAGSVAELVGRQVPVYVRSPLWLFVLVGIAVLGIRRGAPRASLGPLLAWSALAVAGLLAAEILPDVPAYRLLSAAVVLPVLAAAGIVGIGRLARRAGVAGTAVGVVIVVGASALLAADTSATWRARSASTSPGTVAMYTAIGRALDGTARPVVLVVEKPKEGDGAQSGFGTIPALRRFRAYLPAATIPDSAVYLGDPERLLAGGPTLRPQVPGYDDASLEAWRGVEPLLAHDPLVLIAVPYQQSFKAIAAAHPAWRVAPWLLVANGTLDVPATPPPLTPPTWNQLATATAGAIVVLFLAGLGWAVGLVSGPLGGRVALAAPLGLALLALTGIALETLGLRAGGMSGVGGAVALGLTGLAFGGWRLLVERDATREAPELGGPGSPSPVSAARSG